MAQRSRDLFPELSARHALGAELRRLRVENDLSQARLGALVHHSGALIGKVEEGERLPTAELCALVDAALGSGDRLSRMRPLTDPRKNGVPVDFVVSPWDAQTSLRLLRELTGTTRRDREFVVLTGRNLEDVLASWIAATPAPDPAESTDTTSCEQPGLETAVVNLMARRVADRRAFGDTLSSTVLCDLASAELRCLADLIARSTPCGAEYRRLFGLASDTARLIGRLHRALGRRGPAQTAYLMALRCAADAGDLLSGIEIVTAINLVTVDGLRTAGPRTRHIPHDDHRNGERP